MQSPQPLGPRAFLKSKGFVLDKKPHQIDRLLLKALAEADRAMLQSIWAARNMGFGDGLDMYLVPKTEKQAALLFSYDWPRAAATMEWFDQVISLIEPASTIEMGCGAGFLLSFLRTRYPNIHLQGIDAASNLVQIGSALAGSALLAGDYLTAEPDRIHDLIVCDFGFDLARFEPSTTPHTIETCGQVQYCPGCSDDLAAQFDAYLRAWRRWGHDGSHLAIAGRFSNFGVLRALVVSAGAVGWVPDLNRSTVLVVNHDGASERFPALIFAPASEVAAGQDLEELARFFCR